MFWKNTLGNDGNKSAIPFAHNPYSSNFLLFIPSIHKTLTVLFNAKNPTQPMEDTRFPRGGVNPQMFCNGQFSSGKCLKITEITPGVTFSFTRPVFICPPNVMANQIAVLVMVTNCKNLQLVMKLTVSDDTFTVGDETFYS